MTKLTVRELTGLHGLAAGLFPALLVDGPEREGALRDFYVLTHRRTTVHAAALRALEDAVPADLPSLEAIVGKVHMTFRRRAESMAELVELMRQRLLDGTLSDATLADAMFVLTGGRGDEPMVEARAALFGALRSKSNKLLHDPSDVETYPGPEPVFGFTIGCECGERVLVMISLLVADSPADRGLCIIAESVSASAPA